MNGDDERALARLEVLSPDPERVEFVRARCIAQLNRNRRRTSRPAERIGPVRRLLAPVVVFGFCALYIASLVAATLHLNGVIH